MAANTLPSGIGDLFQLAEHMAEGMTTYGPWLLQGSVTADEFSALLRNAQEAEAMFAQARVLKIELAKRFAAADANLTSWLAKARLVVMLAYGNKWSESWIATGFTHRGTNVPKRIRPRMELSRRLADFFAEHREYEVTFAGITAVSARELQKEIATAERNVRIAIADASAKKRVRDTAERRLRHKMRGVIILLSIPLGKSDPRWLAFGLNRPNSEAPSARDIKLAPPVEPVTGDFAKVPAATTVAA